MGIACNNESSLPEDKAFSADSFSELDRTIFLGNEFMKNTLKEDDIRPFFTTILFDSLTEESSDKVKTRHFFKWFEMATSSSKKILSTLNNDLIKQSFKDKAAEEAPEHFNINEIPNLPQEISFAEQGLRNYFANSPLHFESRVLKGPPCVFRWTAWMVMSGLPINRPAIYYQNLLSYELPEEAEVQIQKDLTRTLDEDYFMINEVKSSMYRVLKALTILDKEMSYVQGINYIVGYLLVISNRNEIDTFYFMMCLFSTTFANKFGMRGFYLSGFPLQEACNSVFEKRFNALFPDLKRHFDNVGMVPQLWVAPWMQMIFVNYFPNDVLLRIWDCFFIYGIPFLISFCLSVTEHLKTNLLSQKDLPEIQNLFKDLNPTTKLEADDLDYDIEELITNALNKYKITLKDIEDELRSKGGNYTFEYKYEYKKIKPYYAAFTNINTNINTNTNYHSNKNNYNSNYNFMNKGLTYDNYNKTDESCEDIEDENINDNENSHIQDLIRKSQFMQFS